MKIQLNTDDHIHGSEALAAQVSTTVEIELARFSEHITRIEIHLSDESGSKAGQHEHRCMLETRLKGRPPIAVTEHGKTLDQGLHGALRKLTHVLDSTLGRMKSHRERTSALSFSQPEASVLDETERERQA